MGAAGFGNDEPATVEDAVGMGDELGSLGANLGDLSQSSGYLLWKCIRHGGHEHVAGDAADGIEVDVGERDHAFTENLMRGRVQKVGATTVVGFAPT